MLKKYELIIFDVDGTLLDTSEGVLAAVEYTIEKMKLKKLNKEDMLKFIGPPIQDSFQNIYNLKGDILQEIADIFRNRYSYVELLKAKPYNKIYETLDELKSLGIEMAIATYKRDDYALKIIKNFGFDKYTNIMYGSDHYNVLKKSDLIKKCILDSKCTDCSKIVMVGDTSQDAIGAQKNGIDFIGVTYGFGYNKASIKENNLNIKFIKTPDELLRYC